MLCAEVLFNISWLFRILRTFLQPLRFCPCLGHTDKAAGFLSLIPNRLLKVGKFRDFISQHTTKR